MNKRRPALTPTVLGAMLLACITTMSCSKPEDPARVQLRERLKQATPSLSNDELTRVREEVSRTIAEKKVRVKDASGVHDMDQDQSKVVLGVLTEPEGLYDEGLRDAAGKQCRVLNAPGISASAEIEAARKLYVDVETFLPVRFEFVYAFPTGGDYAFDLAVE